MVFGVRTETESCLLEIECQQRQAQSTTKMISDESDAQNNCTVPWYDHYANSKGVAGRGNGRGLCGVCVCELRVYREEVLDTKMSAASLGR